MKSRYLALLSFFCASQAVASWAGGINIDVNLGAPARPPVVIAQPPAYLPAPEPAYAPVPEVSFAEQPRFIYAPALGCYVTVGTPYDMLYFGSSYYLYSGGRWFVGASYGGPWVVAKGRMRPALLRRFSYDQIRYYRDAEYRVYLGDPKHYRGRLYEPVWKRREIRREEQRGERREERGER